MRKYKTISQNFDIADFCALFFFFCNKSNLIFHTTYIGIEHNSTNLVQILSKR